MGSPLQWPHLGCPEVVDSQVQYFVCPVQANLGETIIGEACGTKPRSAKERPDLFFLSFFGSVLPLLLSAIPEKLEIQYRSLSNKNPSLNKNLAKISEIWERLIRTFCTNFGGFETSYKNLKFSLTWKK